MAFYVSNVKSNATLLPGVIEISWKNPTHSDFKEVLVYRKINDFTTTITDPYATLIYRGTAEKIYDYSLSQQATTDFNEAAKKVLGTYNPDTKTFENKISDPLDVDTIYYYTIMAVSNSTGEYYFSKATMTANYPTKDYKIGEKLYSYLPILYKIEDRNKQLERYLLLLGLAFNFNYSKTTNIRRLIDVDKCPPQFLSYLAHLIGWDLNNELPIPAQRTSLKNAAEVYKYAGTKIGLDRLVKSLSGFPNSSGVEEGISKILFSVYFGQEADEPRFLEGTPDFGVETPPKNPSATVGTTGTVGPNLSANKTYEYRITAYNSKGETLPSPPATATTGSTPRPITITWEKSFGAIGYKVYRNGYLIKDVGNVSSWVDTGNDAPTTIPLPTKDTTGDDLTLIGKGGDPIKYTWDFSQNAKLALNKFYVYVRKTIPIPPEEEQKIRDRLTRALNQFSPAGTQYDLNIY